MLKVGKRINVIMCLLMIMFVAKIAWSSEKWWTDDDPTAIIDASEQIDNMESRCIEMLSDDGISSHPKTAFMAFKYLERIRSEKSIDVMCKRLMYKQKVEHSMDLTPDEFSYPAVGVLKKIGSSTTKDLLIYIARNKTDYSYRAVALNLLEYLLGESKVVTEIENISRTFKSTLPEYRDAKRRLSDLRAEYEQRKAVEKAND